MRTGLDDRTGQMLTGWDHCVQSIGIILTTRIGTRVMQRDFGSVLKELQDANPDPRTMMLIFVGVAEALRRWDPGFRLHRIALTRAGADGIYQFELVGTFYPLGHRGDYSLAEERSAAIGIAANDNYLRVVEVAA